MLAAWPLSVWLAILPLIGTSLIWPVKQLWRWFVKRSARYEQREDNAIALVELLRRALDKGRIRENAIASACDMLIMAVEAAVEELPEPHPPLVETARRRALEHLHSARDACQQIERAGL